MWLLDFANSTPGACLSSCPPALCPWGLAEDLVFLHFPYISGSRLGARQCVAGSLLKPGSPW